MSHTSITVIIPGLAGYDISELKAAASAVLALPKSEETDLNAVIVLPQGTKLPKGKSDRLSYVNLSGEDALYYEFPKSLTSDFVAFLSPDCRYSKNVLTAFADSLDRYPGRHIFVNTLSSSVPDYSYSLNSAFGHLREISFLRFPNRLWVNPEGVFLRRSLWDRMIRPEAELKYYVPNLFLLQAEFLAGTFVRVQDSKVTAPFTYEDEMRDKACYFDQACYFDLLKGYQALFSLLQQSVSQIPAYFQVSFLYFLNMAFTVNLNANTKHLIKGETLVCYYQQLKEVLAFVQDKTLISLKRRSFSINPRIRFELLRRKYGEENAPYEYLCTANEVALMFHDQQIFLASTTKLKIFLMELRGSTLHVSGIFTFPFDASRFQLVAEFDGQDYPVTHNGRYSYFRVFGEELYHNYCYDVSIPLALGKGDIRFYLVGEGTRVNLDLNFAKPRSLLNNQKIGYYSKGRYFLTYQPRRILVRKNLFRRRLDGECQILRYLSRKKLWEAFWLRLLYLITRPFFKKKKIWIFYDKMYKGGDNGEYLFRYCRQQKDGIHKYYILRDDVPDSQRFKREGLPYVKYGSLRHRLLFLNATSVFATHSNSVNFNSFPPKFELYFRDLYRYDAFCIQHGLTVQSIPALVNRLVDNLKLYMLASPAEYNNLNTELYDYLGRDVLRQTGLARYDGLTDQSDKTILITPTWRNYLAVPNVTGVARGYNNLFRDSDYFKIYNSLINNSRLLEAAKKYGYKIKYLLHPVTSSQKDDYQGNEFVEIAAATENLSYEDILTHSTLMVTDYSGVQFDFAYMYKPVVYYHPTALPPSYDEGFGYHMETDALGEIVHEEEELVDLLIQYMSEGCQLHPEYRRRVDDFFYHHDRNNCQRIYEAVRDFYDKKQKK